jgi:hypothetical protein
VTLLPALPALPVPGDAPVLPVLTPPAQPPAQAMSAHDKTRAANLDDGRVIG